MLPTAANDRGFEIDTAARDAEKAEIVAHLKETGAQILVNFLPVGSQEATEFYMECALEAGVGVVNCMPVFIASRPKWEKKFADANLPIIGDDVKAQVGATIVHRVLSNLFGQRGVTIDHTYQLNTGGNTDFMNMLDRNRLASKKKSKTEAVQAVIAERLADENIHVGPSDYIPWLGDNKLCFLRLEGDLFGGVPMNLELPVGRGFAELGGGRRGRDPLREARPRPRHRRRAGGRVGVLLQAPAASGDRRCRVADDRRSSSTPTPAWPP
ncbi:inositol-3-phosphate synthase [Sphingomonas sp. MMS24-JH45]